MDMSGFLSGRFARWRSGEPAPADQDLVTGSDREVRLGVIACVLFFGGLVVWGLLSRLDAAVYAPAQVVVAGSRQAVQHREGGIVAQLNVAEGQHVKAGEIVMRLSTDEALASVRSLSSQAITLQALQARLTAELTGTPIRRPPAFDALTGEDIVTADLALRLQQREFETRATALNNDRQIMQQRVAESHEQIGGLQMQLVSNREQQKLIQEELDSMRGLVAKGYVTLTRLRELERTKAELAGNSGALQGEVAKDGQEIGESRIRIVDLASQRAAEDSQAYRDAETKLGELLPTLANARQQLARANVRAPVAGRVVGMTAFTVGGVVSPGQKLMEIVPDREPMIVEGRVKPSDVNNLHIGQAVEIRVNGTGFRTTPLITGAIQTISADSFEDERSGATYFKVRATVPPSELERLRREFGPSAAIRPGNVVDLVVRLRSRNGLAFLFQPLQRSLSTTALP